MLEFGFFSPCIGEDRLTPVNIGCPHPQLVTKWCLLAADAVLAFNVIAMKNQPEILCHCETAVNVIGGKWKPWILWRLYDGVRRFGELQRLTPGITHKMLTQHLRELERDGVVQRQVFDEKPARVEYSFTNYGESLRPVLEALCHWGALHQQFIANGGNKSANAALLKAAERKPAAKARKKLPIATI